MSRLIIDALALAVYLLVANPALTGLAVHEWLSFGLLILVLTHCVSNADSVVDAIHRRRSSRGIASFVLDVVILVAFMTTMVSGLFVSRHFLSLLGFVAPGYFFWYPVHAIAAKVLLALLCLHIATHWNLIAGFLMRRRKKAAESVD
jgi:hypothetical protein